MVGVKFLREQRILLCDFTRRNPHGLRELTVNGNTMEGTLKVPAGQDLSQARKDKEGSHQPTCTCLILARGRGAFQRRRFRFANLFNRSLSLQTVLKRSVHK